MKLTFMILITVLSVGCKTQEDISYDTMPDPENYTIKAEAIKNEMPGTTDRSPYLIIVIKPKADTLTRNFKINKLTVTDDQKTIECTEIDNNDFMGKGRPEYRNTARDLGDISSGFTMKLELVDENGNKLNFQVNDINISNAY